MKAGEFSSLFLKGPNGKLTRGSGEILVVVQKIPKGFG